MAKGPSTVKLSPRLAAIKSDILCTLEVCAMLKKSDQSVLREVRRGNIPALEIGKFYAFHKDDILELVKRGGI